MLLDKYIASNDFNKFPGAIFQKRLKQPKIATANDFSSIESFFKYFSRKFIKLLVAIYLS